MERKVTKEIEIGSIRIGGRNRIAIQTMLNKPSYDIKGNVEQAKRLEKIGCEIIRVAIPNEESLNLIGAIKKEVSIPLVADIHFDYRLAIKSVLNGADKIRINPGNIGSNDKVRQVVDICKQNNVPIRIGVNGGSLDKNILAKYGRNCPEAMVESVLKHINILESFEFDDIVLSLKSSNVNDTVKAYKIISEEVRYPLHLGVTESGTKKMGMIKSSIGIGSLLLDGIGDTIRVSLTSDPEDEVYLAKQILKCTGILQGGIDIVSCPTCGRTCIDVVKISNEVEKKMMDIDKNIKLAIMGCVVNGPGEAKDADIGVAGGNGCAVLFEKGKVIKKIKEEEIIDELIKRINSF